MNFSVIRGADRPLGRAIAIGLSQLNRHLILIGEELIALKETGYYIKRTSGVQVFCTVSNDSLTENIISICDQINDNFQIDLLVNFSETLFYERFEDYDIYQLEKDLKVNYLASPVYVHQLLPNLKQFANACVLNIYNTCSIVSEWDRYMKYVNIEMQDSGIAVMDYKLGTAYCHEGFENSEDYTSHSEITRKILKLLFQNQHVPVISPNDISTAQERKLSHSSLFSPCSSN